MPLNIVPVAIILLLLMGLFLVFFKTKRVQNSYQLEQFKALFEFATEGIIIVNTEGKIVLTNPKALEQFGYTQQELFNREIEILIPTQAKKHHVAMQQSFMKKPSHRSMGAGRDLNGMKKDGTIFPVEVSLSHYKIGEELFAIAFVIDITIRKQYELDIIKRKEEVQTQADTINEMNVSLENKVKERTMVLRETLSELEKSKDELAEALETEKEVNELKTRFISMASHEFRTPLSSILSSASLISKYRTEEEFDKREKHVNRIKDSVKNLTDILEDFLSIGKLEEGRISLKMEDIPLNDFLETICTEKQEDLAKMAQQIKLNYEGNEIIQSDKYILRNMLINLISNAIKFSPEDGIISVSVKSSDDATEIIVKDNGIGISPEDQEHLFERFFRGTNASNIQGTGLGLYIVSRYLDLLKGSIKAESQLNVGTTFYISLPQLKISS